MPDEHVDVDMKRVILELTMWMLVVSTAVAVGWFLYERYRAAHAILAEADDGDAPAPESSTNGSDPVGSPAPMPEDVGADRDNLE